MIFVDRREKPKKRDKTELVGLIRKYGVKAEIADLPFGDLAFDGYDSKGPISIGIERKTLHDMLACIDDSRFNAHQRVGLVHTGLYQEQGLLLEGIWRYHDPGGHLMEGDNRGNWWVCRPSGRPVLYSKLRRYLYSIQRSGCPVMYTRDMSHTAYDICELWHYYQKRDHTSLVTKQQLNIPSFHQKPPLVRRWAEEIEGVGPKKAEIASRLFKTPQRLADAEVEEWLAVPGVGVKTAQAIVAEVTGRK